MMDNYNILPDTKDSSKWLKLVFTLIGANTILFMIIMALELRVYVEYKSKMDDSLTTVNQLAHLVLSNQQIFEQVNYMYYIFIPQVQQFLNATTTCMSEFCHM